jgi:hypothetical protein
MAALRASALLIIVMVLLVWMVGKRGTTFETRSW